MGQTFYYLETLLALVTMFTILVAAHELGHYLFARLFNMGVEEFAIGFGKRPILQWMRRTYLVPIREGEVAELKHPGGPGLNLEGAGSRAAEDIVEIDTPSGKMLRETTRFTVRAWPLGGFVRIKGMMPEEDGSETKIAGGFYNKPPWQRLVVLFAGPLFSVLAGILVLVPLYMFIGLDQRNNRPIIGEVVANGPAAQAGLRKGDVVKSIDDRPISTFYDMNVLVRNSANKKLSFSILRDGHPMLLTVIPELDKNPSPLLGPGLTETNELRQQGKLMTQFVTEHVKLGFGEAVSKAVSMPFNAIASLVDMVRNPATIKSQVGGTLAITAATYHTVKNGLPSILELAALLSISVGIFNLLPIMPLDGGQMVLAITEMFRRGRRLSIQVQNLVTMFGFAFMCVLIVCVFFIDISRFVDAGNRAKEPSVKKAK